MEQFWDGIYPLPDEDGLATRVAPLTGLNGEDADPNDVLTITATTNYPAVTATVPQNTAFANLNITRASDSTSVGALLIEVFLDRAADAANRFLDLATNAVVDGALDPNGTPFYTDVLIHRVEEFFVWRRLA